MARRAKFGQTPRVQPSLASTLASIAMQMVAREDQNIMDAWKNGGEIDGKKVTDEMVLAYWRKREEGLDHDDPVYDTIQNQIEQLQYAIEQSKMDLLNLQGKVSDRAFAQFYLKWAKKAPRNSEWWRSLQKDAAQLMESAKAKARASADSARAKSFNSFQDQTYKNDIGIGEALSAAVQKMSQDTGLSLTDNGEELLRMVTDAYASQPDQYRALQQAIKDGDPNFAGKFDMTYYANAMNLATKGYDKIADRASAEGYASAFASASKGQANMAWFATNTRAWPVATAYDKAYQTAMKTVNDPNASEMDRRLAWQAFSGTVAGLANTPGIDPAVKAMLMGDADRAVGKESDAASFGPTMLGPTHPGTANGSGSIAAGIEEMNQRADAMAQRPEQYAYAPMDKNGNFDPSGRGAIGIVDANQIPNDAIVVAVPGLDGKAKMVAFQPKTVYMEDPNNPSSGNSQNGIAVGRSITYSVGGNKVTLYETGDSTGATRWSTSSPWNSSLKVNTDADGNVHLTSGSPAATPAARAQAIYAQAQALDTKLGTHIADSIVIRDAQGTITGLLSGTASSFGKSGGAEQGQAGAVTVKYDDKGFHVTTNQTVYGSNNSSVSGGSITEDIPFAGQASDRQWLWDTAHDQSRYTAGDVKGVTFNSAMGASAMAFGNTLNDAQLKTLVNDPEFEYAWITQENAALGITNPLMDTRAFSDFQTFKTGIMNRRETLIDSPVARGADAFQRAVTRTDLTYPGGTKDQNQPGGVPDITFNGQSIKLPAAPMIAAGAAAALSAGPTSMANAFQSQRLLPGQQPGIPLVGTKPTTTDTTYGTITKTPTTTTPTSTSPSPTALPTGTSPTPLPTSTSPTYRNSGKVGALL